MKKFFRKRIKIAGKSFSLALIVGLLIVSVAVAGLWSYIATGSVSFDSGTAALGLFEMAR